MTIIVISKNSWQGPCSSGSGCSISVPRDGTLLGHLFESLMTQSIRVYAQAAEADVGHLRTGNGRHEIDLIMARPDHRVLAIEVKLARPGGGPRDHGRVDQPKVSQLVCGKLDGFSLEPLYPFLNALGRARSHIPPREMLRPA